MGLPALKISVVTSYLGTFGARAPSTHYMLGAAFDPVGMVASKTAWPTEPGSVKGTDSGHMMSRQP